MISSYISLDFNLKYLKGKGYYVRELDLKASRVLSDSLALLICCYFVLKLNCRWVVAEQMIRSTEVKEHLSAPLSFKGYPVKITQSLSVSVALPTLTLFVPAWEVASVNDSR